MFDFSTIDSILVVCKSYVSRQFRLLRRMMPAHIRLAPYPFEIVDKTGQLITRDSWMTAPISRALIFGEYLRLLAYARCGSIDPVEPPVAGLGDSLLTPYLRSLTGQE